MIYIVEFKNKALAETEGAKLIIMSNDGTAAMMLSESPLNVELISSYSDNEKHDLMKQEFWRQPCSNC
jgi:hypothetical protein